jgi:prolyl-tRNA editing enzyme YbaK/EbsC (Cys-tRNA(Pro) deacylase)
MSLTKAKEYLKKCKLDDKIMEFDVSSATVAEAAKAINCKEEEIVKTLSFLVNDKPILIAVAGDSKIDNSKYKAEFQTKAKMIPFDNVEELIGHAVGGVCPFGVNEGVEIYLDNSLKRFKIVYPACGSSNSAVKLTLDEFEKASNYKTWVDVCKEVNNE